MLGRKIRSPIRQTTGYGIGSPFQTATKQVNELKGNVQWDYNELKIVWLDRP